MLPFAELILIGLRFLYAQDTVVLVDYEFLTLNVLPCNTKVAAEHG